jgi:cobalt transporter subunit CbtB
MARRIAVAERVDATNRAMALLAPGVLAIVLGALLVLGAGFVPLSVVHNAAHDARHALFPCH